MLCSISQNFGHIISVIALIVSLYSLYISKRAQCRELEIYGCEVLISDDRLPLYWFDLYNKSAVSTTVESMAFFSDGSPIEPVKCSYPNSIFEVCDIQTSEPFKAPYTLSPHESISVRYFFNGQYDHLEILVGTKERLRGFKRKVSFSADFEEFDGYDD